MRRSNAPSMRKALKRRSMDHIEAEVSSTSESEQVGYEWNSSTSVSTAKASNTLSSKVSTNVKENSYHQNIMANKRIFNIVWRNPTAKKHKTWNGDGTLEVYLRAARAVLKDETGKYLGSANKLQLNKLQEDYEMMVGGKEIQLLDEIKSPETYAELQKQQIANRHWGEEEYEELEDKTTKKPKGAFVFKCSLILDKPQLPLKTKIFEDHTESRSKELHLKGTKSYNQYICLLNPSELQVLLFQKAYKIYKKHKELLLANHTNEDLLSVLQNICNHPSFVKSETESDENLLANNLERYLPEWTEMGPFDSSKFEFVQNFLTQTALAHQEKCVIFASESRCLDVLSGLCDFLDLKWACIKADNICQEKQDLGTFNVLLISAGAKLVNECALNISNAIYFDMAASSIDLLRMIDVGQNLPKISIYYLMTAGYEEKALRNRINNKSDTVITPELMNELFKIESDTPNTCSLHESLECKCICDGENFENTSVNDLVIDDLTKWKHHVAPFPESLLEESKLHTVADNIKFLFTRKIRH